VSQLVCSECGCTDDTPCIDPLTGETCYWIVGNNVPVCSACAVEPEPLVELATDHEADLFIRARRKAAGA
jgi:hypothetical protein